MASPPSFSIRRIGPYLIFALYFNKLYQNILSTSNDIFIGILMILVFLNEALNSAKLSFQKLGGQVPTWLPPASDYFTF